MQRQEEVAPRTKARLLLTQCPVLFLVDAIVHRYQIPGSSAIEHRLGLVTLGQVPGLQI